MKRWVGAIFVSALFGAIACSSESGPRDEDNVSSAGEDLSFLIPCASSAQCRPTQYCTTETGTCNRPPGCRPGAVCPDICYGVCLPRPKPECQSDRDCRTFADYCTGCDCRALANGEPDPVCPGPGVDCFVDPCFNQKAACVNGQCTLAGTR